MSKTILTLFIIFFLLVLLFYVVKTKYAPNSSVHPLSLLNKPTPVSENTLSMSPNTVTALAGQNNFVNVVIDSKGETPSLIQLELAYDPNLLTNVHILPGSYFTNAIVPLNTIDPRIGRISYAIGPGSQQKISKTSNVVAIINFTPAITYSQQTTLYFLPKTTIQAHDTKNTLKVAYGAKILLNPFSSPQPQASSSIMLKK